MTVLQIIQIIATIIFSMGGLVAGAGYGYGQFRKGRNVKTMEDFTLFNTQIDALNKVCTEQMVQITALQNDVKAHTLEIGRLQGINEEKDKKIKELLDLLSNRDPALYEHIKYTKESFERISFILEAIYKKNV